MSDLVIRPHYFDVSGVYDATDIRAPWQDVTNTGVVEQYDMLVVAKGGTSGTPAAGGGARDMSVDVLPGVCWVRGDDIALQGAYHCELAATDNITITDNSSGSDRIDLIVLQISEAPDNKGTILPIAGTPGAGQPDTPDDCVLLGVVTVGNGSTSIHGTNIIDARGRHQDQIYYARLGGSDVRCTQSVRTTLVSISLTLEKAQRVKVNANAGFVADATAASTGRVMLRCEVDGSDVTVQGDPTIETVPRPIGSGDIDIPAAGSIVIRGVIGWSFTTELAAGDHTIVLRADRDANGVINARATQTFNGHATDSTWLEVVV